MIAKLDLRALLGRARQPDATSEAIAQSRDASTEELRAAEVALGEAERAYQVGLLEAPDAALRDLVSIRDAAILRRDRAGAVVSALEEQHGIAVDREAEAVRVTRYEAARAQAAAASTLLTEVYLRIASEGANLLRVLAEAEIAVQAANADLPLDAVRLGPVERGVRDRLGDPARGTRDRLSYPLASELNLPGLRSGDPAFWEALSGARPIEVVGGLAKLAREPRID